MRAQLSQADLFQRSREGRSLRGLGTAGTLQYRDASSFQITALIEKRRACVYRAGHLDQQPLTGLQLGGVDGTALRLGSDVRFGSEADIPQAD